MFWLTDDDDDDMMAQVFEVPIGVVTIDPSSFKSFFILIMKFKLHQKSKYALA